jgi:radical SAM protein with 4Fe4S-binding SPASM domain
MSGLTSASVMLTDACNLNCTYCFEKGTGKGIFMTKEIAEKAVDFLINEALENEKKGIDITYFGGEPTINVEVMNHIFNYAMMKTKENNLVYTSGLITNGVLYSDEYEQFLINWWTNSPESFSIQISFDSIPEINDLQRIDLNGKGSSNNIINSIKKIRDLFNRINVPQNKISVHSVVTKATLPYAHKTYKFFKDELGFKKIWFMALHEEDWDDSDYDIFRREYTKIANDIIIDCNTNGIQEHDVFTSLQYKDKRADKSCGAGVSYCTITPNGDVYPCHGFLTDPDTKIGSVFDGVDKSKCVQYEELYRKYMIGYKACSDCDNYNCRSCMAINYNHNGNIAYGFPKNCKLLEIEKELSIYVYEELFGKINKPDKNSIVILQEMGRLLSENFTEGQIVTLQHLLELQEVLLTEKFSLMMNERECNCHDKDQNSD